MFRCLEVAHICLPAVGQHRDAARAFPGREGRGDLIGPGVDHRNGIAALVNHVGAPSVRSPDDIPRILSTGMVATTLS
jgi:hypothetical protein